MSYVDMEAVPGSRIDKPFERELRVIMSPQTHEDVTLFTLMMFIPAPNGGCTDFHAHEGSGELVVVLGGRGRAFMRGKEYELRPGIAIYAPPGVTHKTLNTGNEPLKLACVFVPPVETSYVGDSQAAARGVEEEGR
jgi:mannose-6-phosphate isomerase-like protein (cupin superfamily)